MKNLHLIYAAATSLLSVLAAPVVSARNALQDPPAEAGGGESLEAAGQLTDAALEDPVGFVQKWLDTGKDWIVESGPGLIGKVILFLVLFFAAKIVAGLVAGIVRKALSTSRMKVSDLLREFAINTTRNLIICVGLLFALAAIGIPIGPFLAALGVAGFVIGFALQDTMSNFAAGVMILIYHPFDVGDVVSTGGVTGKVHAMTLVSTTLLTPDNQVNVVPNGTIWGSVITNVTANSTRRVDLTASIGYDDDIEKAEKVLARIVKAQKQVLSDPAPVIRLHELADSSVNFVVRVWTNTSDYWDVYWDLTRAIKVEFDKEGLSIPYPQQDVHMHEVKA